MTDRLSQQSIFEQASDFLGTLINGGFIDTPIQPMDNRIDYIEYFERFLKVSEEKRVRGNWESYELLTAAKTARWQESHLDPATHPDIDQYWAIECSRFVVPEGQIGFLKYIEQVVNDIDGSYYPTNCSFWGSPTYVDPDVDNLRWYLRLSPFYGTLPVRLNLSSAAPIPEHTLPGVPYSELPIIDGLWYPAHLRSELKLIVPGRYVLRLIMVTPPTTTYRWVISGKLSGMTQSTYQDSAIDNARRFD